MPVLTNTLWFHKYIYYPLKSGSRVTFNSWRITIEFARVWIVHCLQNTEKPPTFCSAADGLEISLHYQTDWDMNTNPTLHSLPPLILWEAERRWVSYVRDCIDGKSFCCTAINVRVTFQHCRSQAYLERTWSAIFKTVQSTVSPPWCKNCVTLWLYPPPPLFFLLVIIGPL